jgi:hypothetical protein
LCFGPLQVVVLFHPSGWNKRRGNAGGKRDAEGDWDERERKGGGRGGEREREGEREIEGEGGKR